MRQICTVVAVAGAALMMTTGAWHAQAADAEPSGTISVQYDNTGMGLLGFQSGEGKLTLKDGSVYAVTMDAYSLVDLGFAKANATGRVYNLEKASDFSGEYAGTGMHGALGKGQGKSTLKNVGNNVRLRMDARFSGALGGIGLDTIVFRLGQRLKGPDLPPVAAAPVSLPERPAPLPVAIQKPTDYTLYFGFDKARVNLANRAVLDAILADWKGKETRYRLVGHADMVGATKYNMLLSQKRADAVKQTLIEKGIPAQSIVAVGVGQKELAVPTRRGQRLRQNRRVTLTVHPEK